MNTPKLIFIIYIAFINALAIAVTVLDKYKAVHHKWRIRESALIIISLLGGGAGMYLTMLVIRHKTKHLKFMLGIPLIILLQTALLTAVTLYGK